MRLIRDISRAFGRRAQGYAPDGFTITTGTGPSIRESATPPRVQNPAAWRLYDVITTRSIWERWTNSAIAALGKPTSACVVMALSLRASTDGIQITLRHPFTMPIEISLVAAGKLVAVASNRGRHHPQEIDPTHRSPCAKSTRQRKGFLGFRTTIERHENAPYARRCAGLLPGCQWSDGEDMDT